MDSPGFPDQLLESLLFLWKHRAECIISLVIIIITIINIILIIIIFIITFSPIGHMFTLQLSASF